MKKKNKETLHQLQKENKRLQAHVKDLEKLIGVQSHYVYGLSSLAADMAVHLQSPAKLVANLRKYTATLARSVSMMPSQPIPQAKPSKKSSKSGKPTQNSSLPSGKIRLQNVKCAACGAKFKSSALYREACPKCGEI